MKRQARRWVRGVVRGAAGAALAGGPAAGGATGVGGGPGPRPVAPLLGGGPGPPRGFPVRPPPPQVEGARFLSHFGGAPLHAPPPLKGPDLAPRRRRPPEPALPGERGAKSFRPHTGHRSEGNLRLYRRVGYETVGTAEGTDGVPMIVLEKAAGEYAATA